MAPPKFGDLGKSASDLFKDDFGSGSVKLTLKSTTLSGAQLKVEGCRNNDNGTVCAGLETKYSCCKGVAVKEKWCSNNVVTTELTLTDKGVKNSKLVVENKFAPTNGGMKGMQVKAEYKTDSAFVDVSTDTAAAKVNGVFSYRKYLFGVGTTLDTQGTISNTSFAVGYVDRDVTLNSTITNGSDVEGSVYHTPRSNLQAGVKFAWNKNSQDTAFAVAGRYQMDSDTFVKAKLDTNLNMGLSYTQNIRAGVKLGLYGNVNAAALSSDSHTLGMNLTLEA